MGRTISYMLAFKILTVITEAQRVSYKLVNWSIPATQVLALQTPEVVTPE